MEETTVQKTFNDRLDWLKYRSGGIGSSDSPIIMGDSPYSTPLQLYNLKMAWQQSNGCGPAEQYEESSMALDRGKYWEPVVRRRYEDETGLEFPPINFERGFRRASLDGWNEDNGIILEIKVPGKEVIELAKQGIVHPQYVWQLEHQLYVTPGAREVHFRCARTNGKGSYDGEIVEEITVIYKSDPEKRERMLKAQDEFWKRVQDRNPPPLTDRDVLKREDPFTINLFSKYKDLYLKHDALCEQTEELEKEMEELKKQMISNMAHVKEEAGGVQISKVVQNRLDTSKLESEGGVDLSKYRKEITFFKMKVLK